MARRRGVCLHGPLCLRAPGSMLAWWPCAPRELLTILTLRTCNPSGPACIYVAGYPLITHPTQPPASLPHSEAHARVGAALAGFRDLLLPACCHPLVPRCPPAPAWSLAWSLSWSPAWSLASSPACSPAWSPAWSHLPGPTCLQGCTCLAPHMPNECAPTSAEPARPPLAWTCP